VRRSRHDGGDLCSRAGRCLHGALWAGVAAYSYGEGIGRLACISFDRCYGKDIALTHPRLRRIFERSNFTFAGVYRPCRGA
jgi:hypothetical protein